MRQNVSEHLDKLDIERLSKLLQISHHRIIGALKRKTLQYVDSKPELFRFDKSVAGVESGTAVFVDTFDVVRGFPKISRTLMLYPAVKKHFSSCKKVVVEEKMNGYNARVTLIGSKVLGLTRGGFVCPYTTEKVNELLPKDFFIDNPNLVLCGEMVGPDNPYVPNYFYDIESIEFFAFDIQEKVSGKPMPVKQRRKLLDKYGIRSVRFFGEFDIYKAHVIITNIIKELGEAMHEGVVIKDPEMIIPPIKYTCSESNCADLRYAFEFYNDYGRDFFFGRVCREAFQSVEWDEDEQSLRKRCLQLGESILLPMIKTIKKKKKGERIAENVQIMVKNLKTVRDFEEYLRFMGVDAVFEEPEKIGDQYLVRIKKINHSTNDKTGSILNGALWS